MKEHIREMLMDVLPTVDLEADFLFTELDSISLATILMTLAYNYQIELGALDATPKNLRNLDSIVAMVQRKLDEKKV